MSNPDFIEVSRLLPSERQQRIRQLAMKQTVLRVSDLSSTFGVSEMTIRRDLEALEGAGHIERTFGGAVALEQASFESSYSVRLQTHTLQKEAIASYASSLIQDGDTVALDASTTALILARKLNGRGITVLTNSLDSAQALRNSQTKVVLTGGYLRQVAGSFTGPLAVQTIKALRVDHAFISAKGVLIPDGLMDSDIDEVEVKRSFITSATNATALIDSSKFGKHALSKICDLDKLGLVLTDSNLNPDVQDKLGAHGVNVHVVESN